MKAELRELDIQHASLAGELLSSLAACSQLTSLRATHAGLSELPPQLLNLPALAALDVSGNGLTVLPASIGQLTGLTRLALGRNQLTALPSQISCLMNLVDLDVSRNALAQLPSGVGACTALVYLNAMANELAAAPPELGQLSRLYRLGLKSNRCAGRRQLRVRQLGALSRRCSASPHGQLPFWLGAADKSPLGFCTLRGLPADVRRAGDCVPDVAQMTIYHDHIPRPYTMTSPFLRRLRSLPSEFGRLGSLVELFLTDNQLEALPAEVAQLTSLVKLQVKAR